MRPIIRVENLGKQYSIGERRAPYQTLRESLTEVALAPLRWLRGELGQKENTIWALKDVSFEVWPGEVVGIIGRNGAGKSTLLKVLSRITEPTEGQVDLYGRVASLLEVGTGFHPELTGRDNIYLNGAILGMKRTEIARKFNDIVSFAEVEQFLDTPVKHYSSGMYVRLAFAVAAHLQPEILLVDEVLAVGDLDFQKKCIGRMEKIAHDGRTVIIVSHSMSTVQALCPRAILLEAGRGKADGLAGDVVSAYLAGHEADVAEKIITDKDHLTGVKQIRIRSIRLANSVLNRFSVYWQQPITIAVEMEVLDRLNDVAFGAGIRTIDGVKIFTVHHDDSALPLLSFHPGRYSLVFTLQNDLRPGLYKLHLGADLEHIRQKNLVCVESITLEVLDHSEKGSIPLASNEGLLNGTSTWDTPSLLN